MKKFIFLLILVKTIFGYQIIDSHINDENEEIITLLCDNSKELKIEKIESVMISDKNKTEETLYIYNSKAYKSLDDLANKECK
ncbi:hypothetical protein [Caminibacter pacificus]|jgi:hypothetical protein